MDSRVGVVLKELDALGLYEETLVVMHSDHGWNLGEHGQWQKFTNWETGVRVPLIIRAPWLPKSANRKSSTLAELVDVYPTVVDLAGAAGPPDSDDLKLDGTSLGWVLRTESNEEEEEIERAFKIVDADGDGKISKSELQLYLFGLGCNLDKEQMDACPASCDEAQARELFDKCYVDQPVTLGELKGIFSTWDPSNQTGKVSWSQITKPVGDGNDIEFPDDVLQLFERLHPVQGKKKGDEWEYEDFMNLMARTMGMKTGSEAPIEFDSDLFKVQGL